MTNKEKAEAAKKLFAENIEEESAISPDELLDRSGARNSAVYKRKHKEYLNIPASFDIETTSFYVGKKKQATMYEWTFGLNGIVTVGRTWEELFALMDKLREELKLSSDRLLVVYCHNLQFEFQFLRKWFEWSTVFATGTRRPVYTRTDGFEFRCSFILSGYNLETLGKNLTTYRVRKLVGDLDYSKPRHSGTPLTDEEWGYCVNDVRVVMAYIQEKINEDGNITRLQLTKTGYVRKYCRDSCMFEHKDHKKGTWKALNYRRMMEGLTLETDEYLQLRRGFHGGFTHANMYHSGEICKDVDSYDFTSSYPAQIVMSNEFPMSKGELKEIRTDKEFRYYLKRYACLFDISFRRLRSKEGAADHFLSVSKCWKKTGETLEDNGRIIANFDRYDDEGNVIQLGELCTTITNIDFEVLEAFYEWDSIRVKNFRVYRKGYLPKDLVDAVLTLYEKKTQLKGVEGMEAEYMGSKEKVNACFGMMVTDIVRELNEYKNGEWLEPRMEDLQERIKEYNEDPKRFLFYPWGVWVTALAQRALATAIAAVGPDDYIYADTDSVKIMHAERHQDYFENYNRNIIRKLEKAMKHHGFPVERIRPKTVKGVEKPLGVWDHENEKPLPRFKTLGAKRYIYEDADGGFHLTVSGVNKKFAVPYLLKKYGKDGFFEKFEDELVIPGSATGKMTHTYIDEEMTGTLTDYLGNEASYHELSGIHLESCEYSLELSEQYLRLLMGIKEQRK